MKESDPNSSTPVVAMLSWVVAVAAAWLAVSTQSWAQTLLIAAVGGLYLFSPPSGIFPRPLLVLFGLALLLATTAFLPANWLGASFHQPFLDHGINLPSTLSPQPWLSLEDLTLFFTTFLWAWICFETKISLEQRKLLRTCYVGAMGLVAVVAIVHGTSFVSNLPEILQDIGQFANRNQTSDLLVMAGIICFAQAVSDLSKGYAAGAAWIGLTGLFMTATFRNGSRAGCVLFAIGLLIFVVLMPKTRHRPWLSPVLLLIVFLGGMLIFALGGGDLQSRFQLMFAGGPEGRVGIYRDAAAMVLRDPWCGVGLGNFEGVFNIQRVYSAGHMARCLHPESDWFWIAVELGLIGVFLFAAIIALTFRIYLWKTPFRRLSRTCITVAAVFLLHSLFDVGGHRLGTVWSCIYLVSLGAFRPASATGIRVPRVVLHAVGLLLLLVAALRIQSMSVEPLMPTRASLVKVTESLLLPGVSLPKQKEFLDRSIVWAPLNWDPYYRRALVNMDLPDVPDETIDGDFNRALFLEQNSIDLPIDVGEVCRSSNFAESLVAWKALMRRAGPRREEMFENLYGRPNLELKVRVAMATLTEGDPSLKAIAITHENPPEFDLLLQDLLKTDPSLEGISPKLLEQLFDRWVQVGNVEEFLEKWPLHREWRGPGWKAFALGLAQSGRFKEAVATVLQFMPAPTIPDVSTEQDLDETERQYQYNPKDPFLGICLYFAQIAAGLDDQARNTLVEVAKLPQPPSYIRYLLARSLAGTGQDEAAWKAIEPVILNKDLHAELPKPNAKPGSEPNSGSSSEPPKSNAEPGSEIPKSNGEPDTEPDSEAPKSDAESNVPK